MDERGDVVYIAPWYKTVAIRRLAIQQTGENMIGKIEIEIRNHPVVNTPILYPS